MAGLRDDAQWIVMMGFVVSFSFFFLAMILNQSTVVGQTTAESVLDFPKNDIRDVRDVIIESTVLESSGNITTESQANYLYSDIKSIALSSKKAVVDYSCNPTDCTSPYLLIIHYNNGVTSYNETWVSS
jgi:hypothetical protein